MKDIYQVWSGNMKNNKGMTLVEIIISIALIAIVLLFLFMLLVTVNDINIESEINSTYLLNKAYLLNDIENDLSKNNSITLTTCDVKNDIYSNYSVYPSLYFTYEGGVTNLNKLKGKACVQIDYNDGTEKAKIGVYYYKPENSYSISYIHGHFKKTFPFEDFEKYNINGENLRNDIQIKIGKSNGNTCGSNLSGCTSSSGDVFSTITIPIIGPDEKDYSIVISYYGRVIIG